MSATRTILVVDDSSMIRRILSRSLSALGYEVATAKNGAIALSHLNDGLRPMLIVCDVNMPIMSGIEFLEDLAVSACKGTPVIMLTTLLTEDLVACAQTPAAHAWLPKPVDNEALHRALEKLIGTPPKRGRLGSQGVSKIVGSAS